MSVGGVFLVSIGTALATGLGALPLGLLRSAGRSTLGVANALAGGFMLGASIGLLYEGAERSATRTVAGAVVGGVFILLTSRLIGLGDEPHVGKLRGAGGLMALMVIGLMTVHSFTEGVAVGVSFAEGGSFGVLIALAIAVHNVPEGLAIGLTLVPQGESVWKAFWWSVFSSLPQPLMAVPAFIAVRVFEPLLPYGLGFAGGAMVWMVFTRLVPESYRQASTVSASSALLGATVVMVVLEVLVGF